MRAVREMSDFVPNQEAHSGVNRSAVNYLLRTFVLLFLLILLFLTEL